MSKITVIKPRSTPVRAPYIDSIIELIEARRKDGIAAKFIKLAAAMARMHAASIPFGYKAEKASRVFIAMAYEILENGARPDPDKAGMKKFFLRTARVYSLTSTQVSSVAWHDAIRFD